MVAFRIPGVKIRFGMQTVVKERVLCNSIWYIEDNNLHLPLLWWSKEGYGNPE